MDVNWQKASYTVEAAIIIPFFFGILLFAINTAISFYEECVNIERYDSFQIEVVETFYQYQKWKTE